MAINCIMHTDELQADIFLQKLSFESICVKSYDIICD